MGHPAQFTPAILEALTGWITKLELPVHDPFAGTGQRLGQLCDRLGVPFTGTEIEPEYIVDHRVNPGDSTMPLTYPAKPYVIVTSPVYPNGMTDHFRARDDSKRHTYRQALAEILGHDRPLHPNNMGRYGNRHRRSRASEAAHWNIALRCVKHWPDWAIVNVKDIVATSYRVDVVAHWRAILATQGYRVVDTLTVETPGQRNGANSHLRADTETVLVADRGVSV